jgi:predicted amidohydrolase YtcJ
MHGWRWLLAALGVLPFILCFGSGRFGSSAQGGPADLIFHGGRILTLEPETPPQALAVRDGRILSFGEKDTVLKLAGPATRIIDLRGKFLLPAFTDHHIHLLNVGLSLLNAERKEGLYLDLSSARSLGEIGERVHKRASELPSGTWILGKGWNQAAWGGSRLPTDEILSRAAPRHPVYCARADGHAGWLNRAAMEIAGIDGSSADPKGGVIVKMGDGTPSGILLERANELVIPHLPQPTDEQIVRAFRLGAEAMAARGVVEIFDAGFLASPGIVALNLDLEKILNLLKKADTAAPLPIRVHLMVPAPSRLADLILLDPQAYRSVSPNVDITHIKLFCDGALGSRGAALSHPYADDGHTQGVPRMTEAELSTETMRAIDAGLDVAVHAIGDEAVHRTLDAFEAVLAERPGLRPGRLRIEHFSYASAGDISRAARSGVVLSIQPNFVLPDANGRTMEDARLGRAASQRAYAWATLAGLHARLAFGSDYFAAPAAPLLNLYAAVSRANPDGLPAGGWHPAERLSRLAALRLMSLRFPPGSAEPSALLLRTGGTADLVILSANPLEEDLSRLLAIQVDATIRGGKTTYSR